MVEIVILDTGAAFSLYAAGGSSALDFLTSGGRQVYVSSEVFREIFDYEGGLSVTRDDLLNNPAKLAIFDWIKASTNTGFDIAPTPEDARRYIEAFTSGNFDAGDVQIMKLVETLSGQGIEISILTDNYKDFDLLPARLTALSVSGVDVSVSPTTVAFFNTLYFSGEIDAATYNNYVSNLMESGRTGQMNSSLLEHVILDVDPDLNITGSIDIDWGLAKKMTALSFVLKEAGFLGDAVQFTFVAAEVSDLYKAGRIAEAEQKIAGYVGDVSGGALGGFAGGALALAGYLLICPEPTGGTKVGAAVAGIVGALAGMAAGSYAGDAFGQEIMAAIQEHLNSGQPLLLDDIIEIVTGVEHNCFAAGTSIGLTGGASKAIESIVPGDFVLSYDASGTLVSGRVTRTFRNEVSHLLDVHGLKVTPGHATLCGEGMFRGRHVPIIDILLSDGALVQADGTLIRMAINAPVGSTADAYVKVAVALTPEDIKNDTFTESQMRVGTLLFDRDGVPISVLDCLTAGGCAFDPETGLVAKPGEAPHPLFWFGRLPRPEDYILTRSQETLEGILVDGEWEGGRSELIEGRLRQTMSIRAN